MTSDNNMSAADLAAIVGNNDGFGNNGAWWLLILLIFANNGWGNNGGFGGGNNMYPWFNQLDATNAGFQNAQLASQLAAIQAGINANQNALQQTGFNIQTAILNSNSGMQSQLAQCCCENRLATANLQSVIASENCADRQAVSDGIRDVLANNTMNTQRIVDLLTQLTTEAKNDKIADLERQLTMANLAASQTAQTAQLEQFILANKTATAAG